jgi:hypothetical protein
LALAGCGSSPGTWIPPGLGLNRLMAVPRPFKAAGNVLPPASGLRAASDISLTGLSGLPPGDDRQLAAAIARACDPFDILVQAHPTERKTSLLEGAASVTPSAAGRDVVIDFNWRHPDGTLGGLFEVRRTDPKSDGALDPETITALGGAAASQLALAMGVKAPGVAATHGAIALEAPRLFIGRVSGAPGDGNRALAAAISAVLTGNGFTITPEVKRATHSVGATVTVAEADPGAQTVSIVWRILDPAGKLLGEVTQTNAVSAGSLDKGWGDTAYDVASAAAEGLMAALERLQAPPAP